MIASLLASLLFVAGAQDTTTAQTATPPAEAVPPETSDAGHSNGQAPGDAAPETQGERANDGSGQADEPEVCRRVTSYDDFGRQHSRRVCRPRN